MTEDAEAIVAAILTALRLAQQGGPPKGRTSCSAYRDEFKEMLDRIKDLNRSDRRDIS